jgi:lysophospholipase L1-like esterase
MAFSFKKQVIFIVGAIPMILLALSSWSCKKKIYTVGTAPQNDTIITPPVLTNAKRLLSLGDSYTIGQGVTEPERFPNQTIDALKALGANMKYPAQIIAQTGWTTQNLLYGMANANPLPVGPYDLVTLLIGVNNQYQRKDTGEYRTQFTQCLEKAIFYSGNRPNRVFVLSIPDYGATPFGSANAVQIGVEIDRFNAINKQVCDAMAINYTDITPSTRLATTDPSLVAADNLHPSGKEYAKWAAMLKTKMLGLVQ